jgi:DNA polymerase III delta prime subunit
VPSAGLAAFHAVICDEADCMSDAAQKYLLSKLDSTEAAPNTIWIFTCNSVDRLEDRFLSRCIRLDFNSYGAGSEIVDLLARVWKEKAGDAPPPNLKKIAGGNIRTALQNLESELLAL